VWKSRLGKRYKFIGMDPKNKGGDELVLETRRGRQMSFTIVYY